MLNENRLRLLIFFTVAVIHIVLIFFLSFKLKVEYQTPPENARMMRLTDFSELIPAPPPPPPPKEMVELPQVESIAETIIETDIVPDQVIVAPGTITSPAAADSWSDALPQHMADVLPKFNESELLRDLVYPPIAQRSGIEGRVILELFVDRSGQVQHILILQENPKERGFGDAAVKVFTGRRGTPAYKDDKPISIRYRYPVSFKIK
jgi:protein TonB